jgi:hypothetical protein
MPLEFTDWAVEILTKSDAAARRFNPDARIRLARVSGQVQAVLTDQPGAGDEELEVPGGPRIYVEAGLAGLVDIEEPHDRLVLRRSGSEPNPRGQH